VSRDATERSAIVVGAALLGMAALSGWDLLAGNPREPAAAMPSSAQLACVRPSEVETLLVFVNVDAEGRVRVSCGSVGSAGAYVKEARP
jgi:hypothetical protein